jgi:hypothetical protein
MGEINMKFQISKKLIILIGLAVLAGIVGYRIYNLATESAFQVYNIAREYKRNGTPVDSVVIKTTAGVLREPLYVKNGRAYVSANRRSKFVVGAQVGENGRITSVSDSIDMDTGLYVVRVSGASGDVFAMRRVTGIFVPNAAVQPDGTILIADGDVAVARSVAVVAADADQAVVRGLNDGDRIILSKVAPGAKIKLTNE